MFNHHTPAPEPEKDTTMDRPYAVVLADGHQLVRRGIMGIMNSMNGLQIVGEAADGRQLLDIMKNRVPDMVVVDISMPSLRDLEAIKQIKAIYGDIKILFLSMHEHQEYLNYALQNGADGFVIKGNLDLELLPAIEKIRRGQIYISPQVQDNGAK